MKNKLFLFLFISVLLIINNCGDSSTGDDDNDDPSIPDALILNSPKAIFLGSTSDGSCSVFEILSDDTIQDVAFQDQYGNEITVDVSDLIQLNSDYYGIIFTYSYMEYKIIFDISNGIFLDFSDYDLDTSLIKDNYLYTISNQTIYKINLDTQSAEALNNPEFDPIGDNSIFIMPDYPYNKDYPMVLVNDDNLLADAADDSSGYGMYEIYSDNSAPSLERDPLGIGTLYYNKLADYGFGGCALGDDGFLYEFRAVYYPDTADAMYDKYTITSSGSTIDTTNLDADIGRVYKFDTAPYDIFDQNRFFVFAGGYYEISPIENGGFNFSFVTKIIPTPPGSSFFSGIIQDTVFSGQSIYSKDGDTIYKMDIVNDAAFEAVINHSDIIEWWVANETIVFTAYITGTNIGTYSVDSENNAVLIDNSDMAIRDIHELNL
jgi:hypothetical protein